MKVSQLVTYLDQRFPKETAASFDQSRIGFTIGSLDNEITNVMLALDLTSEVLEEAINNNCNFIITHHPFIWDPITKLIFEDDKTKIIKQMLINNISLYSMHTNLDVAQGGVNDSLAKLLGIKEIKSLELAQGNYLRFGMIEPLTLQELCEKIKKVFDLKGVRYIGVLSKTINSIGIVGGAGSSIGDIINAIDAKIDCYITGEIRLNCAQFAYVNSLSMIEVNHGVERFVFPFLKEELEYNLCSLKNKIMISQINTDPLKSI